MFFDRSAAGIMLAKKLMQYQNQNVVIYALTNSGAVVAYEVAKKLAVPLDMLIVQKVGHPISAEYGICAVTEDGEIVIDECGTYGLDDEWITNELYKKLIEAERLRTLYKEGKSSFSVENKIAILVDDGLSTGISMRAAIQSIERRWPDQIIVAAPVAPHYLVQEFRATVDDVFVVVDDREYIGTVGSYYMDYTDVSECKVISLLQGANQQTRNGVMLAPQAKNFVFA